MCGQPEQLSGTTVGAVVSPRGRTKGTAPLEVLTRRPLWSRLRDISSHDPRREALYERDDSLRDSLGRLQGLPSARALAWLQGLDGGQPRLMSSDHQGALVPHERVARCRKIELAADDNAVKRGKPRLAKRVEASDPSQWGPGFSRTTALGSNPQIRPRTLPADPGFADAPYGGGHCVGRRRSS